MPEFQVIEKTEEQIARSAEPAAPVNMDGLAPDGEIEVAPGQAEEFPTKTLEFVVRLRTRADYQPAEVAASISEQLHLTEFDIQFVDALGSPPEDPGPEKSLRDIHLDHIRTVLKQCDGNKTEAARRLGIDRRTLYRWMEKMGKDAGRPILVKIGPEKKRG